MTTPDRSPLVAAARRKHDEAVARATSALRDLDAQGETINFQRVARAAGVSRQWLYQQPEIRGEIEKLRGGDAHREQGPTPTRERARQASLQQRIETLLQDNQRLRNDVTAITGELAIAYGRHRLGEQSE